MRKGGAHTRSITASRARARRSCEDEAADYLAERATTDTPTDGMGTAQDEGDDAAS